MANSYDKRSDFNFGIDDIYDDEMYGDDKLDQVLDEIAEIKKTIQGLPEARLLKSVAVPFWKGRA